MQVVHEMQSLFEQLDRKEGGTGEPRSVLGHVKVFWARALHRGLQADSALAKRYRLYFQIVPSCVVEKARVLKKKYSSEYVFSRLTMVDPGAFADMAYVTQDTRVAKEVEKTLQTLAKSGAWPRKICRKCSLAGTTTVLISCCLLRPVRSGERWFFRVREAP